MSKKELFKLNSYTKSDFKGDLPAGLVIGVMLIPQGMAYAMLAGLPPVTGLYASIIPLVLYAILGSSRHLSVGPVAVVSLLVMTGVSSVSEPGTAEYVSIVVLLMFMVGIIQSLMGLLKIGFIVNFISHAVISAFTSAAAIVIGLSQLQHLTGLDIDSKKNVIMILFDVITRFTEINFVTFAIGLSGIILLIFFRKTLPKIPGSLAAVVLSILAMNLFSLNQYGVEIIGYIPDGLPAFSIPVADFSTAVSLLPVAVTISLIGFIESIAMGKIIATKEKYKISSNRELLGLGVANLGGSFFSGYPVTGSFSRSAVNYDSGAKTKMASVISAVIILLSLLFLTDLFYYLPNALLASIIMVAVWGLIDFKEAKHLFKVRPLDGIIWAITFICTLVIGIEQGIIIGIIFSLSIYLYKSAYPEIAELGLLPEEQVFRNIERYPEAQVKPDVLIYRVDSDLFFANMSFVEDRLRSKLVQKPEVEWVILDLSGVNSMDAVAIQTLEEIIEHNSRNIRFKMSGIKGPVRDLLKKAGWDCKFGNDYKFLSIQHALDEIREQTA